MSISRISGALGEEKARNYLVKLGYHVESQNYRYKRSEIDLIVSQNNLLVFIEVKYRNSKKYGEPEEFVTDNQKNKIIEAADNYINERNWNGQIRFDIISIGPLELKHFEDAFY